MDNSLFSISVQIHVKYDDLLNWEDVKQEIIQECDYMFKYKRHLGNNENNQVMVEITNTEIQGEI